MTDQTTTDAPMTSAEMNEKIREFCDREDWGIEGGKCVPYIGWWWREVDFDQRITFGDCGTFVGFMENNKWGYPQWDVTPEQDATVKAMLRDLCAAPTEEKCEALWDYIQTCTEVSHG